MINKDTEIIGLEKISQILSGFIYGLAVIFGGAYCKFFLHMKVKGRKNLKRMTGDFFIYGNHTQPVGDVFIPALCVLPKRIFTVVSTANYGIPVIGKILPYLGALPIVDSLHGFKELNKAIETRIKKNHPMANFFNMYKGRSQTSCPNVTDWIDAFGDAEDIICVTITSALSGSYNSACLAKQMYEEEHEGRRVFVLDTLSAGPEITLITLFRANVLDYISYMRNIKNYHPKSVNNHLSSLRAYNEFLISSGCQTEMAILKNDFMKVQVQYANPCTVEQKDVEAFRQRLLEGGSKRDFAIVTLYTYTGIRRSECVNLKLEHVDLVAKEIYIVGKGDKYRTVYLNDKTVHAIREYLKVRNSESPYLFVSRQSDRMAASRINQIFNQYSDIITPKMLRHYFCSHALDTGEYRIHEVANQAGHSNVQTTLIYSNPSARQMKEKANKL